MTEQEERWEIWVCQCGRPEPEERAGHQHFREGSHANDRRRIEVVPLAKDRSVAKGSWSPPIRAAFDELRAALTPSTPPSWADQINLEHEREFLHGPSSTEER